MRSSTLVCSIIAFPSDAKKYSTETTELLLSWFFSFPLFFSFSLLLLPPCPPITALASVVEAEALLEGEEDAAPVDCCPSSFCDPTVDSGRICLNALGPPLRARTGTRRVATRLLLLGP